MWFSLGSSLHFWHQLWVKKEIEKILTILFFTQLKDQHKNAIFNKPDPNLLLFTKKKEKIVADFAI